MKALARLLAQALFYAGFVAFIGYFSTAPAFAPIAPGQALLRLSFSHAAQRKAPCRERSAEELAKLAPNMRAPMDCTRERSPVVIELDLDSRAIFRRVVEPSGYARDGAATVYFREVVPAGTHRLTARMSDGPDGRFNFSGSKELTLKAGRVVVIDFDPNAGGFVFKE
jgi:hypothetical protein